jgi:predicted aldo/keto reductase-like oxidoreductase
MYVIVSTAAKVHEKTTRCILQDVQSLEKLEWMEKNTFLNYIQKRKKELKIRHLGQFGDGVENK